MKFSAIIFIFLFISCEQGVPKTQDVKTEEPKEKSACDFNLFLTEYDMVQTNNGSYTALENGRQVESKAGPLVYKDSCDLKKHLKKWWDSEPQNTGGPPFARFEINGIKFDIDSGMDNIYVNYSKTIPSPLIEKLRKLPFVYYNLSEPDSKNLTTLTLKPQGKFGPNTTEMAMTVYTTIQKYYGK